MPIKVDYAVQESVTNMRRNLFVTFAAVLVVSVSLFLFGGFFLLRGAIARTADLYTGQVRVTVFLAPDVSTEQRDSLQRDLLAMPEVRSVQYENKQQAYATFKRLFASQPDIVRNTTPDALPESFRIQLQDPRKFEVIRDRLEGRPGIGTIRDERETVNALFSVTGTLRKAALVIAIVVGIAAMVLIATTIRMAIYSRRKEIEIMKLVGATNWFIRVPFMMEGVVEGLIGATVAALLLIPARPLLSSFGPQFIESLKFQVSYTDILVQGLGLLLAGVVVGGVGSLFGLRRFLDV
jgi:cell division transport system permease protein